MNTILRVGDTVDNFESVDAFGKKFTLHDIKQHYALISFLRYSGCPFCNLSVHRLALEHPLLKENRCDVVTFVQSSAELILQNIYDRHQVKPTYAIIPDKQRVFYNKFGVKPTYKQATKMIKEIPHWVHSVREHGFMQKEIDGNLFISPAIFLVNMNTRKLVHVEYASDLFSHDTFSRVYEAIAADESGL